MPHIFSLSPCYYAPYVPSLAASVFVQILWWIGNALEALVLVRSVNGRLFRKYPAFYLYLGTVLLLDLLRFSIYILRPQYHPAFYWYTEYLSATIGYAVILEIYKQALSNSPGVARIARTLLWAILGAVILNDAWNGFRGVVGSVATTSAQLERDMRTVQALLLAGVIALLVYYHISPGKNLRGIIFGYGVYIYAAVVSLAFGSLPGYGLRPGWRLVQPITYLAVLLVWVSTLWSYSPNPTPKAEFRIDRDYRLIAVQTRRAIARARSLLKMGGEL